MKTTQRHLISKFKSVTIASLTTIPVSANAQSPSAETSAFDEIWSFANLYKDDRNPILEEFKLRGRYQGQYWDTDANQGSQSNWEDRRSR